MTLTSSLSIPGASVPCAGAPKPPDLTPLLAARFWRRVEPLGSGCWRWTGTRSEKGYGLVQVAQRRNRRAHRVIYELLIGPIGAGLVPDHLCANSWCVNPLHIEPVTVAENTLRGYRRRRQAA